MKIKNFLEKKLNDEIVHEGKGLCKNATVVTEDEIDAPVRFINYAVIPPSCSFGLHQHGNDNEFYIILCGEGVYQQNGVETKVKKGDIIMNAPFATHGIANTGKSNMEVLVFEVVVTD